MVMLLSVGNVWGATADVTYDFTGSGWTVSSGTLSNGVVSFTGEGGANFKMNSGYFMMGKSGAYINFPTYAKAVEKIVVTGRSGASAAVGQNIYVGEAAVSTETTGATGANTYEIASASQAAGTTYTLKVTTAHNTQITKIEIFYVSETPGGDPDPEPDPEPTTGDVYELFSGDLVEGDYVIYYGGKAMNTTITNNRFQYAEVTPADDKITTSDASIIWHIAQSGSYWTIYNADKEKYAAGTSSKNQGALVADGTADLALWTATESSGTYNFENKGRAAATSDSDKKWLRNNGTYGFATYASGTGGALSLYKKADGKQNTGLAYDAADQKKLVKFGDAFTAPTLVNPNNLTVAYASNNTAVAEVASNGAVTIKAAGVAVITASFAGNDDYKAGSASYTIGVTTHAGTEADPYVAADAKIAIDAMGTVENAYATGIVSNVVTTTLPQEGYITFYFSADGATTGQQIEAYKCYGLNSAAFEAVSDVETGATVVVTGNLKKYNSTYEFDQNCHLVSYEAPAAPKQSIANDQAHPYTVAQALTFAADGVTYDLDDYVYVQGVVYDVKSFSEGVMNIFIKDANAENQFELYKCAGINDGSATTPFEALTDVQAGNIVIGYGQLTVYNTTYEFKQGNYLVDLQKPVTGIELDATAEVEAGSTVNLTATILPSNATGTIDWTVETGSEYASVDAGVVTGIKEGEATIRATVQGTEIYAECTVTVNAGAPVLTDYYEKVTETAGITDGTYLIVYEAGGLAFNGGLEALDAASNTIAVAITNDNKIGVTEATAAATFFIDVTAGSIQAANGKYIGVSSNSNGLKTSDDATTYTNAFAIDNDGNAVISAVFEDANITMRYNKGSGQERFRYYASGQQPIALYKLANEVVKANPELAWSAESVEITLGETFTAPTLDNPHSVEGITFASDNEALATVTDAGVIELVADATGMAHITASFAGNDDYKAVNVSCTITVNAAPTPAETKNVVIIAEYNSKFYAMSNSLGNGALAGVEVEKDGSKIVVSSAEDKAAIQWTATVDGDNTTLKDANDYYIKGSSGASLSLEADPYNWNWDGEKSCYISSAYTNRGLFFNSANNVFKGYALSNITSDGYAATEVIEIDPEDIVISSKVDPALAYDPEELEIEAADIASWSAPVLGYATGFDGLAAIEYGSNNESVATVTEGGEISLAGGYGTAVITATFGGNTNYLAGSATYTITVNAPAPTPTGTTYTKVTSTGEITDGEYLIVYETTSVAFNGALETLDAEGNSVAVVINEGVIAGTTAIDAAVFTIDVTAGTLQSASGKYIGVSSNSNGLKQTEDASMYTHTFSIDGEGNAVILANFEESTMKLRYNPSTSAGNLRFRYYKNDGQQAIQLYKKETPEPTYTEVRNGLTEGWYYTMCLDKAVTAVQGGTIWRVLSKAENGTDVILEEVTGTLEAGRPYIFYATADILEVVYAGSAVIEPVDDEANHGLKGSFIQTKITQSDDNYIIYNNALYFVNSDNVYVGANRAYLDMTDVPAYSDEPQQGAPRRRVVMAVNGQNGATGFENINATEKPMKLMIDGKIYILRGEKMYDATGRLVK